MALEWTATVLVRRFLQEARDRHTGATVRPIDH